MKYLERDINSISLLIPTLFFSSGPRASSESEVKPERSPAFSDPDLGQTS